MPVLSFVLLTVPSSVVVFFACVLVGETKQKRLLQGRRGWLPVPGEPAAGDSLLRTELLRRVRQRGCHHVRQRQPRLQLQSPAPRIPQEVHGVAALVCLGAFSRG